MGKAKGQNSFQKKGVSSQTKFPLMHLRTEIDDWERLVTLRELFKFRDQGTCTQSHSCVTLCDPMDCSPLGSSVHGIL